jgi:hypothetical protein
MRAATAGSKLGRVAAALLLSSLLFLSFSTLPACEGPCQRHSDCPSKWMCGAAGTCEPENVITDDPPDASDDRVHDLADGALDDSDHADPPDAAPDAS